MPGLINSNFYIESSMAMHGALALKGVSRGTISFVFDPQ
jgi:adenine deaminase